MHSSTELSLDMFQVRIAGQEAAFRDLIPNFSARDRLGVVARAPLDAIWASSLILAAVTAFYDEQRRLSADFFIYPDYFIFHPNCSPGQYAMFDVWPDHKVVSVEDTPEAILRAVNDRGVTILVLPDREARSVKVQRQTCSSALSRLHTALLYCPAEAMPEADVTIGGNAVVEGYVDHAINKTEDITATQRDLVCAQRQRARAVGRVVEAYRRISPDLVLQYL